MFGLSRKERATKVAIKAAWPWVIQFRLFGRKAPAGFWFNPYALGVLTKIISVCLKLKFGDKLKPSDAGMCLLDAYGAISGDDPIPIAKAMRMYASTNHPAFVEGSADAEKYIALSLGSKDCDQDPQVVRAYAFADKHSGSSGGNRQTRAAEWFRHTLFYERLAKELGIDSDIAA